MPPLETDDGQAALTAKLRARIRLLRAAPWSGNRADDRDALFADGLALAEGLEDKRDVPLLFAARAMDLFGRGLMRDAYHAAEMTVSLVQDHPRADTMALAPLFASTAHCYGGFATESLRWAEQAVAHAADDPDRDAALFGAGALPRARHSRAEALILVGRPREAGQDLDRAVALLRARGEEGFLPWVLPGYVRLSDATGADHRAEASAAEAVRLTEEGRSNPFLRFAALEARGLAALLAGRPGDAAGEFTAVLAETRRRGVGLFLEASLLAHLGRARLALGDRAGAETAAAEAVEVARRQGTALFEVLALLVRGMARGHRGDLQAALALARETGAAVYQPPCLEQLARLSGDRAGLGEAADRYAAVGASGHSLRLTAEMGSTAT